MRESKLLYFHADSKDGVMSEICSLWFHTGEFGEKVLSKRSKFRNL